MARRIAKPEIAFVVGARPNIIKVDPLIRAAQSYKLDWDLVHTGQHYDYALSQGLFNSLGPLGPNFYLNIKGDSRAERVGLIIVAFEQYCRMCHPDLVVVVGDVDSTVACAMAAKMSGIRVAHVEAGCRSGESSPEEQNRIMTDEISDYLYCRNEGDAERVGGVVVGDPAIDTLHRVLTMMPTTCKPKLRGHILLTLHRPENVDTPQRLEEIMSAIRKLSEHYRVIFPAHPRTVKNLSRSMLGDSKYGITATAPVDYLRMIRLMRGAALVITDSGGMQLDTSYLKVPCITVREITEHGDTIVQGTNFLAYTPQSIFETGMYILYNWNSIWERRMIDPNPLWDGQASTRIINHIREVI